MAIYEVIFRHHSGETFAVFPAEAQDVYGNMLCYAHIGQHGTCSDEYYSKSRPATHEEIAPLLAELKQVYKGDILHVMKRRTKSALACNAAIVRKLARSIA